MQVDYCPNNLPIEIQEPKNTGNFKKLNFEL